MIRKKKDLPPGGATSSDVKQDDWLNDVHDFPIHPRQSFLSSTWDYHWSCGVMYSPLFAWFVGRTPHYSLVYAVSQKHQVLIVAADSVVLKTQKQGWQDWAWVEKSVLKEREHTVIIIVQVSTPYSLHRPANTPGPIPAIGVSVLVAIRHSQYSIQRTQYVEIRTDWRPSIQPE